MAKRPPKYSLHKASGQAFIRINQRSVYLGVHGTPDSLRRYADEIDRWQQSSDTAPQDLTIGQLTMLYAAHARRHYVKNGKPTSKLHVVTAALKALNQCFRNLQATEFSPRRFKAVRDQLIDSGRLCRTTINDYMGILRRMMKWAVAEEILPVDKLIALQAVPDLRYGRSTARETDPVCPVSDHAVDAVRPFVSAEIWAMIQLQRFTGMRPGEALNMRGADIVDVGGILEYRPVDHKMKHKSKSRIVLIGEQGQKILQPWLNRSSYLFSPTKDGTRPYRRDSYTNAIKRGCELAFGMPDSLRRVDRYLKTQQQTDTEKTLERARLLRAAAEWRALHCWSPNQLRHNFATLARREAGIEGSRVLLGHSSAVTTEIYAERDLDAARAVVAKIG